MNPYKRNKSIDSLYQLDEDNANLLLGPNTLNCLKLHLKKTQFQIAPKEKGFRHTLHDAWGEKWLQDNSQRKSYIPEKNEKSN